MLYFGCQQPWGGGLCPLSWGMGAVKATVLSWGVQGPRKRLDPSVCHQRCLPLCSWTSALFPLALLLTALWTPVHVAKPGSHQTLTEGLSPGLRPSRLRLEAWAFLESQGRTLTTLSWSLILRPQGLEVEENWARQGQAGSQASCCQLCQHTALQHHLCVLS